MKFVITQGSKGWVRAWSAAAAIVVAVGTFTIPAMAQSTVSAQQADQIAQSAVSGSTLLHTSADHVGTTPVWDIHVTRGPQVWDVKVNAWTGTVLLKRLTTEQHSTGRVTGFSGLPAPSEHHQGKDARETKQSQNRTAVLPQSGAVVFNQKLTAVPAAYQSYVTQALHSVGGTLKWVKFSRQSSGNIQMNIKIHKPGGGTTKIKMSFNRTGQFVIRNAASDN